MKGTVNGSSCKLRQGGRSAKHRCSNARAFDVSKRTAVSSGPHDRFGDSRPSARGHERSFVRGGRGVDPRPALRALEWTVGRGAGSDGIRLGLRLRGHARALRCWVGTLEKFDERHFINRRTSPGT